MVSGEQRLIDFVISEDIQLEFANDHQGYARKGTRIDCVYRRSYPHFLRVSFGLAFIRIALPLRREND